MVPCKPDAQGQINAPGCIRGKRICSEAWWQLASMLVLHVPRNCGRTFVAIFRHADQLVRPIFTCLLVMFRLSGVVCVFWAGYIARSDGDMHMIEVHLLGLCRGCSDTQRLLCCCSQIRLYIAAFLSRWLDAVN